MPEDAATEAMKRMCAESIASMELLRARIDTLEQEKRRGTGGDAGLVPGGGGKKARLTGPLVGLTAKFRRALGKHMREHLFGISPGPAGILSLCSWLWFVSHRIVFSVSSVPS
jgi:hypothetical protein